MLKIDVHTHILPERWPDLRERYGYGGFIRLEHQETGCARMMQDDAFFREVAPNTWDPAARAAECDRTGVDVQVLSTVPVMFSYWAKPKDTLDLSRILNDHLAEVVREHPRRFVGLGTLPMQAPDLAIPELERCMGELGLCGIEIGSHINEMNLDDPLLFPVFQRAAELGAAIFVHPWDMMGMPRMPKYWLPWLVGMPAETSLAICSLIFGGVFERLPELKVIFAHGGGSFPATFARVQHGFDVRPDLCAVDNPKPPRDYLDRIYIDSLVHSAPVLRYLIELLGAERIALGSDYPFPLGEHHPGKLIESMDDLTDETKARLLGGTALELFGLAAERFTG